MPSNTVFSYRNSTVLDSGDSRLCLLESVRTLQTMLPRAENVFRTVFLRYQKTVWNVNSPRSTQQNRDHLNLQAHFRRTQARHDQARVRRAVIPKKLESHV